MVKNLTAQKYRDQIIYDILDICRKNVGRKFVHETFQQDKSQAHIANHTRIPAKRWSENSSGRQIHLIYRRSEIFSPSLRALSTLYRLHGLLTTFWNECRRRGISFLETKSANSMA